MCEIIEILGSNIRNLRKECGWTQEKLAEKADISVPFMTQIELGRKSASLEVIEKIAKALGVSYEMLFKTEKTESKDVKHKLAYGWNYTKDCEQVSLYFTFALTIILTL